MLRAYPGFLLESMSLEGDRPEYYSSWSLPVKIPYTE